MRISILTLFLSFSFFAACDVYAGSTTLMANYPATSGSYNKVVLNTQPTTNVLCSSGLNCSTSNSNIGLLYYDIGTNALKICTCTNSQAVAVPFPETCFNRFWNGLTAIPPAGSTPPGLCPSGYTQAQTTTNGSVGNMVDSFSPDGGTTWVYSTACCISYSTTLPSS